MSTFSNRIARKKKTENHEVKPGTTETTPAEVPAKPEKEKKVAECFFLSHINGIIEKKGHPIIRNLDSEIRYK